LAKKESPEQEGQHTRTCSEVERDFLLSILTTVTAHCHQQGTSDHLPTTYSSTNSFIMNSRKQTTKNAQKIEADLVVYSPRINKDIFVITSDKVNETLDQMSDEQLPFFVIDSIRLQRNSGAIPANHNQVLTLDKSNMSLVTLPKGASPRKFKSAYDIMMSSEGSKSNCKGFGK